MKTSNAFVSISAILATLLSLLVAQTAEAVTIHADGTTCTLADAIIAANTDTDTGGCPQGGPGADVIVLDADVTLQAIDASATVHESLGAGLPDVTDDLTIRAGLGRVIRRDPTFTCSLDSGDPVFRFFNLQAGSLTLETLRLENGCTVSKESITRGGGIRAEASTVLTLDGVAVGPFEAYSSVGSFNGSFLYTDGDLTLNATLFEGGTVEATGSLRGGLIFSDSSSALFTIQGGTTFRGFSLMSTRSINGMINSDSELTIENATFENITSTSVDSSVQGGAVYSSSDLTVRTSTFRRMMGTSGSSLQGGAIYSSGSDGVQITDSTVTDIDFSSDGSCQGGAIHTRASGPYERLLIDDIACTSASAVQGGALYLQTGLLGEPVELRDTVVRDVVARSTGSFGDGGAVYGRQFVIERCAFIDNRLIVLSGGRTARGGALFARFVSTMRNVTFEGNVAQGGESFDAEGGDAKGGAVALVSSDELHSISASTFTGNRAIAGQGADGFADGQALGGGLYVDAEQTLELANSIVTGNEVEEADGTVSAEDCFADGTFTSLGYNLVQSPDPSCVFAAPGDTTGMGTGLYPAADYGCVTGLPDGSCVPVAAIDQTSAAADAGSCLAASVAEDARQTPRPFDLASSADADDGCDIGAFEAVDSDGDGVTEAADCAPDDSSVSALDRCGVCGGDGTSCPVFESGFESGDLFEWSFSV